MAVWEKRVIVLKVAFTFKKLESASKIIYSKDTCHKSDKDDMDGDISKFLRVRGKRRENGGIYGDAFPRDSRFKRQNTQEASFDTEILRSNASQNTLNGGGT